MGTLDERTVRVSSPDGLLALHRTEEGFGDPAEDWTWHLSAGEQGHPVWSGRLTARTPRDVIEAGLTALARPEPVLREARWLPYNALHLIRVLPSHWVPGPTTSTAANARSPHAPSESTLLTPAQAALGAGRPSLNPPTPPPSTR
ncbi:DUF317 domain-containing protein [Streptomyces sp. SID3343]|nr:DUF317 domain-containing protein [Streptomyces sp. SID3343]